MNGSQLHSHLSRPFRVVGPRMILRELRVPIELSTTWPLPERMVRLDVFGIGWIDTDSDRFLEFNLYASTSEPSVRPGSHPFVVASVELLFEQAMRRLDPAWFSPELPGGPFQILVGAVPVDLQRKWRRDHEGPAPSLPVETVSDRDFADIMRKRKG